MLSKLITNATFWYPCQAESRAEEESSNSQDLKGVGGSAGRQDLLVPRRQTGGAPAPVKSAGGRSQNKARPAFVRQQPRDVSSAVCPTSSWRPLTSLKW